MQDKEFPTPGKSTAYHQLPKKVVKYDSLKSVFYAIQGISFVVRREPNLTIQFCVGVVMAALAGYNGRWITAMGNLILMSIVMSLEIVNSVIETLCDLIEPNYSLKIKHIKDMAAGSVLIVALAWLVVIAYQITIIFIFKNQSITLQ
jgi:diacylglycerol kinase